MAGQEGEGWGISTPSSSPLSRPPTTAGLLLHNLHLSYQNKISFNKTDQTKLLFKKEKLKIAYMV